MQKKCVHQNQSKTFYFMLWRLHPQAPDCFRLNPPSQLDIGYHWLAFLNQVRKESQTAVVKVPNSLKMLSRKLSQKIKIAKTGKLFLHKFQHSAHPLFQYGHF